MQVAHHRLVAPDGAGSDAVLRRQYPVDVAGPGIADQPEPRIVGDAIGLFVGVEPHQRREGTENLLLAQAMAVGIDFRHGRAEIETAVEALWPLAAAQAAGAPVGRAGGDTHPIPIDLAGDPRAP